MVHSRVNDTNFTSFESATFDNCYIGVDGDGNIIAPNKVPWGSLSSQFLLELVFPGEAIRFDA